MGRFASGRKGDVNIRGAFLHMAADAEERRIVEQIERVNSGLGAVAFNRGTRLRLCPGRKNLAAVSELTERARAISGRTTAVSFGDDQAILDQYADILLLRERLAGATPEDRQWTRDALDVRNRFDFYCEEHDAETGETIRTYSNAGDNSGGEQEKLMAFCLAGALSFNLASPHGNDNRPIFAQLMLDEAFSKSDPQFAQQALHFFLLVMGQRACFTRESPHDPRPAGLKNRRHAARHRGEVAQLTGMRIAIEERRQESSLDLRGAPIWGDPRMSVHGVEVGGDAALLIDGWEGDLDVLKVLDRECSVPPC